MRILEGDCLQVLATLESGSVDAVITDPPYCSGSVGEAQRVRASGQGRRSETIQRLGWFVGDNMGTAGLVWLMRAVAVECRRIVRPTGSLVAFCDWRMLSSLQPAIEAAGLRYQNLIVWDKGSMGLGSGFRCRHELAMHFTFGSPVYHHKGIANVIGGNRVTAAEREHHAQKPVSLMQDIAKVVCPPGGLILDPFMGSGSTGVAALREGFGFIGIEQDPAYVAISRKRLAAAQADCPLFPEA